MLSDIPNISDDLIVRIVGAERWTGVAISIETLEDWRKEAKMAFRKGNVGSPFIALSSNVKRWYTRAYQALVWSLVFP